MFLLTFLKDTGAVDFQDSRVVFVFLVETHAGQINRCLPERHMTRVGKEEGRRGGERGCNGSVTATLLLLQLSRSALVGRDCPNSPISTSWHCVGVDQMQRTIYVHVHSL